MVMEARFGGGLESLNRSYGNSITLDTDFHELEALKKKKGEKQKKLIDKPNGKTTTAKVIDVEVEII